MRRRRGCAPSQLDGSFGVRFGADGDQMPWGNAVIGVRNPIAPPLVIEQSARPAACSPTSISARPTKVRPATCMAGVAALILDHVLGAAASSQEKPRLTGTITLRYLRTTRLGPLRAEARIDRIEGVKTYAVGHLADDEGVTVEAKAYSQRRPRGRGRGVAAGCDRPPSCGALPSRGGIRSRTARLFAIAGTIALLIGWVGDLAKRPIRRARLVRSWVSHRSAISTRNALPTPSEDNARISAWAAAT